MSKLRELITRYEDKAPVLFSWLRYYNHVVLKNNIVYPQVTKRIFKLVDSKNAIAVDVGANVGIVTRYLSQYFAVTHAVEPLPYLYQRLKHFENSKIKVHHCALGADNGEVVMRTPVGADGKPYHALSTASATNALNMFEHASIVECTVPLYQLSNLITAKSGRVGYLKIDVEGFEHAVLLGATTLIERDRPIIQMEIEKTHNPNYMDVIEWMRQNQYLGYSLEKMGIKDNMLTCLENQMVNNNLALNAEILNQYDFLFIPLEKASQFKGLVLD
ncbi:MAG TPA: FkbM family methyltransferase [Burkholderiaceae bacterium]|nr:FkbM family methyltransferase [Burkholderiaceae bacterium]